MSSNPVERCAGPLRQRGGLRLLPVDSQPIIERGDGDVTCQYLQPNGSCSAIKELLPSILRHSALQIKNLENNVDPSKRAPKRISFRLRAIQSEISLVADLITSPPVCKFLHVKSV